MKSIRNKLSLATCSLLTTGNVSAEAIENAWEVDSSYLHYSEVDRVTVNKLVGFAKGYVSTKDTASIKVVFDSMSGATPTGAVINSVPSFTGASGGTSRHLTGSVEEPMMRVAMCSRDEPTPGWVINSTPTLTAVPDDWRLHRAPAIRETGSAVRPDTPNGAARRCNRRRSSDRRVPHARNRGSSGSGSR